MSPGVASAFELRFRSLFGEGRGFAFPCDAQGHVDLAVLSERGRESYRLASALVGRDLALPTVEHAKAVVAIGSLMPVIARQPTATSLDGASLCWKEVPMGTASDKPMDRAQQVACEVCLKEVPVSEAVMAEATDYFTYFCGLECYEQWKHRGETSGAEPAEAEG